MATVISTSKKREFINTEFHQYFNISLKSAKAFYQGFSHDVSFNKYSSASVSSILNKYEDSPIEPDYQANTCMKVIDGDTLVLETGRKVRLVGVNAPEKGVKGYETSKKFVEKLCLNKDVDYKIDSKKEFDKYGRTLGVILVNGKNLNQILLQEGLAEIMYIPPSEFNPRQWAPNAPESNYDESLLSKNLENQFINVVIPFKEICGDDYGIGELVKYLNDDFSNLVVTKSDDFNVIYKCESYKKTLFIRIEPISVSDDKTIDITVHLLPKRYDGTDSILIFKDDYYFLNNKIMRLKENFSERFYKKHRFYLKDKKGRYILDNLRDRIPINIINSYFQSGLNGKNRADRFHINNQAYPEFDKFDTVLKFYQDYNSNNQWIEEAWPKPYDSDKEMYAEYSCDISKFTGNMNNLQIDSCYTYNTTTATNAVHYTGCKDNSNYDAADRCVLIDANLDNIIQRNGKTNYISQMQYIDEKPHFPISTDTVQQANSYTHKHTNNLGTKHYKTVKYFNDRMYSEEKSINDDNEVVNHGHTVGDWKDLSQ